MVDGPSAETHPERDRTKVSLRTAPEVLILDNGSNGATDHHPEQYHSTLRDVEKLKKKLIFDIHDAIDILLRTSGTVFTVEPQWSDQLQSPFFFEALSKIYGITTEEQLQNLLCAHYPRSLLGLRPMLKAILAAVISHWVLEKQHDRTLRDPTDRIKTDVQRIVSCGVLFFILLERLHY